MTIFTHDSAPALSALPEIARLTDPIDGAEGELIAEMPFYEDTTLYLEVWSGKWMLGFDAPHDTLDADGIRDLVRRLLDGAAVLDSLNGVS